MVATTPEEFVEEVRNDNETALSRLGSSKALYADTEGSVDREPILLAAANAEFHAEETLRKWADAETNDEVREFFEWAADQEAEHYATVTAEVDGFDPDEPPAIQAFLRQQDDTVGRVGGFLGRTLAAQKSKQQMVGFFVGDADPQAADTFRDLGGDLDEQLDRLSDLLLEVCDSPADWERASDAASGAIQAAYDEYTERLEGMGVNPKPVC